MKLKPPSSTNRCPYCDERLARSAIECALCGEVVRTAAEVVVLVEQTDAEQLALDAADEFLRAYVQGAPLRGALLGGADLFDADLAGADLRGADLGEANLGEADLSHADLSGANLVRADLSEANLCGADLTDANLTGANLHGARYDVHTVWSEGFDQQSVGAVRV